MALVRAVDGLGHRRVVGLPAARNPRLHFGHAELARVNGLAVIGGAPDQALAQPHLAHDLGVDGHGIGPGLVKQADVDLRGVAVGVKVAARKKGLDPARAQSVGEVVEFFDMGVFGAAQGGQRAGVGKVVGVVGPAVG